MKKETRFNRKISDFFWAVLSWLPSIMLLFTFILICFSFNQVGVVTEFNIYNCLFDIFVDFDFVGVQFEQIWENISYAFIPDFIRDYFEDLYLIFGDSYFFQFITWQILHLVFIAIVRLLTNVLLFLPKIGNYFINKWSGD